MRLSPTELHAIKMTFREFFSHIEDAKLYLHGSRVDDTKKGGDIDLLVLVDIDEHKQQLRERQAKILGALYRELGEQKIDITIATQQETTSNPFVENILRTSIKLIG